jgi:hypothetical protein
MMDEEKVSRRCELRSSRNTVNKELRRQRPGSVVF